jgi:hypothetical protein
MFNGSGLWVAPGGGLYPVTNGTLIDDSKWNVLIADIGTALSNCITKDGQTTTAGTIPFATAVTIASTLAITSTSANALAVGPAGTTNPTLKIDANTASAATGISIKSAAAAGGVALSAISSGTNENLTIDAKGSGTITLGGTSTGAITIARALTVASGQTLTLTGTTITGGTPTFSGLVTANAGLTVTSGQTLTLTGANLVGLPASLAWQVVKRKTADESITSSTTLQDDDHLTFAIGANEEWILDACVVFGNSLNTTGIQTAVTVPSGATLRASTEITTTNTSPNDAKSDSVATSGAVIIAFGGLNGANGVVKYFVWVLNGATPGNVTLQWSPGSNIGTALTAKKGSFLRANRIA